jgi:hypothetical protein
LRVEIENAMTNRFFYQADIATFLSENTDQIFGVMARADEMDTAATQKFAWSQATSLSSIQPSIVSYIKRNLNLITQHYPLDSQMG